MLQREACLTGCLTDSDAALQPTGIDDDRSCALFATRVGRDAHTEGTPLFFELDPSIFLWGEGAPVLAVGSDRDDLLTAILSEVEGGGRQLKGSFLDVSIRLTAGR